MRKLAEFQLSALLRHALVQNTLSLYGVQIASYIAPLITVPYLSRVLGPTSWGLVAFTQAFGAFAMLLGEYGFNLSATREVARNQANRTKLAEIVAGVLGAKSLLAAASLVAAIAARPFVPIFRQYPELLWAGTFWGMSQALSMLWFFQGLERMRLLASLDISTKLLGILGIVFFVRSPQDGWRVLVVQGFAFFLSFVIGLILTYREVVFRLPTWRSAWEALRLGWTMFLFKSSVSLYASANAFILGFFGGPQVVGYYAAAERISRASVGLLGPVSQALYPRLSHMVHHSRVGAARLARIGFVLMGSGGLAIGALIFFLASLLIRIILGREFESAVPVLRILALLPPLIALSHVYGIQWMLPLGLDRPFNAIILLAGLINVGLAATLAPRFADIGMAWAVVTAEAVVTGGMYMIVRLRRLDPMSYAAGVQGEAGYQAKEPVSLYKHQ